jgi:hypothetical protein
LLRVLGAVALKYGLAFGWITCPLVAALDAIISLTGGEGLIGAPPTTAFRHSVGGGSTGFAKKRR